MKRLLSIAYYLILGAVVALGLLFVATLVPVPGNYDVKIVQSGSMAPTIDQGDVVVISPQDEYEVDDIITYGEDSPEHVPTTHRIVDMEVIEGEIRYTTKGDANDSPDPNAVAHNEVIGEVVFTLPWLGYVLTFARQPLGFALLIGLPALIVTIDEGRKIYRELMRRKQRDQQNE